jgi:hypothetical protein
MKIFAVVLVLILGSFILVDKNPPSVIVVPYYYEGNNRDIIEKGLNDWKFLKNVKFVRSKEQNFSTLKIVEVTTKQVSNPRSLGEYYFYTNTIKLNADKQLTRRQWIAVVSHEVGHYFLLQHSEDKTSIMSNNFYLNANDVKQSTKNVSRVALINKARGWLDPLYPLFYKKF